LAVPPFPGLELFILNDLFKGETLLLFRNHLLDDYQALNWDKIINMSWIKARHLLLMTVDKAGALPVIAFPSRSLGTRGNEQ